MAGVKRNQTSLIIGEVAKALVKRSREYIKWPGQSEMRQLADENNEEFGLPNVPLGVDGTLINLSAKPRAEECPPGMTPDKFYSGHKKCIGINVQVVGNARHMIRDIVVQWPGSVHDSRIWRNSRAKTLIEQQREFAITADSAYPLTTTCLKPFAQGAKPTAAHEEFNGAQSRLRNACTEKKFGHVKSRFRIMRSGIDTRLEKAQMIIISCLVLNNMAL